MNETVTLKFKASGQYLKSALEIPIYASNTVGYLYAEFELGSGWSDFDSIRAIWQSNDNVVASLLDTNNRCIVPAEVLDSVSPVTLNLVGSTEVNGVLTDQLTTFPILALTVHSQAFVAGLETPDVTPSLFEQFINDARNHVITEVEAETLDTGYPATVSYSGGVMSFGLPRGDRGETGATPNFSIGQVETLDPSFQAEVYINGTAESPVLNFRIPKGDPGEMVIAENGLLVDDDGYFYVNI